MSEEMGKNIIKKALRKGCDEAEVFVKSGEGLSIEAKNGKVEAMEASRDYGLALKVIKKHRIGFAFATNPDGIEEIIDKALAGAEWTNEDEFSGVPGPVPSGGVKIFDEKITQLREDDIIRDALLLEESALGSDKRIKKVRKAEVSAGSGNTTIINSKGVNISYRSSYYSAHVTTLAEDKGDSQMGWDFSSSRRRSDVHLPTIGNQAAARAIELLGSRKISSVRVPVILSPQVAVDFLDILSASLSSEAVQKQRSFLIGKVGQTIISRMVDIIDDGTMAWRSGTKPVDDEGVPTMNKPLISGGSLQGYIYNTYTAKKDGVSSTGNATRAGFKSLPGVGVTNIYIKAPDSSSGNGLVTSLPRGIHILGAMGVHMANPISGDFSVGISGRWIENGESLYPVKEAVMSGNILDMFKKVEALGNDLTFYGNTGSPSVLIGDMEISA